MYITKPIINEIAERTWFINEFGHNAIYVLEGSERALVVDCGTGFFDLKKVVESLTDKPYDVAITHAHPDHVGLMHQFDQIYINRKELDGETIPTEDRKKYSELLKDDQVGPGFKRCVGPLTADKYAMIWNQKIGFYDVWKPLEEDVVRGDKDTELIFIDEGYVFDLGDRKVSTIFLPGHSKGGMIYIDSLTRIAFTGDAVNFNNGSSIHAASTHIRYLQHFLEGYGKTYDRIYTGHTAYGGSFDAYSEEIEVVYNLIEAYRALLRGEAVIEERARHTRPDGPKYKIVIYGDPAPGRLNKNPLVTPQVPPKLWEDGEEQIIP